MRRRPRKLLRRLIRSPSAAPGGAPSSRPLPQVRPNLRLKADIPVRVLGFPPRRRGPPALAGAQGRAPLKKDQSLPPQKKASCNMRLVH